MLVLLSDPALPRKAPRGGGEDRGGLPPSELGRGAPPGPPGTERTGPGAPRLCGAKGKPWGGSVSARSGAGISQEGAGRRFPARLIAARPWGRRAALPRRRREAAGPAAAARNRALGAAFRRGAARGSAAVGAQRCATTSGGSRCRWNVSVAGRYAAPRQRRAGHLQVSAGERKTYTAPYRLRM